MYISYAIYYAEKNIGIQMLTVYMLTIPNAETNGKICF